MANDSFRFRQFEVRQDRCAMKVGTDGVLLGSWASAPADRRISVLDIGTGTGLVALMMAQRFALATVLGIEIDSSAATQAAENAANSPFGHRVGIVKMSLQEFLASLEAGVSDGKPLPLDLGGRPLPLARAGQGRGLGFEPFAGRTFDAIVCNPPYFSESLECPDEQRNMARHTNTLDAHTLMACSAKLLAPGGLVSLVVPYESREDYHYEASIAGLFISRICTICTKPGTPPKRILLAYTNTVPDRLDTDLLVIGSDKHKALTSPFYLESGGAEALRT